MRFTNQIGFAALLITSQAAAQYNEYLWARDAEADYEDSLANYLDRRDDAIDAYLEAR